MSTTVHDARHATAAAPASTGGRGGVDRSVAWQLARFEARKVARHPATLIGLLLSSLLHWANSANFAVPFASPGPADVAVLVPMVLARLSLHAGPLLVGLLIATFLTASRSPRHDTQELLDPAAARPGTRVLGLLGAGIATVGMTAAWTGLAVGYVLTLDTIGTVPLVEVIQPIALAVLVHGLGIALGTWTPRVPALLLGLAAITFWQVSVNLGAGGPEHTLGPVLEQANFFLPEFQVRPLAWHAVYIVGVGLLAGTVAVLRHGATTRRLVAAVTSLTVVATGVAAQFAAKPTEAELAEIVDLATAPDFVCTGDELVTACSLPAYTAMHELWAAPIRETLLALPADLRPSTPIRIEQAIDRFEALRPVNAWYGSTEEGRRLIDELGLDWDDVENPWGYIPAGTDGRDDLVTARVRDWPHAKALSLAVDVARRAVGIPASDVVTYTWTEQDVVWMREQGYIDPDPADDHPGPELPVPGSTVAVHSSCWLAGQAREAVAVLLAATSSPRLEDQLRWIARTHPYFDYDIDGQGRISSWRFPAVWLLHSDSAAIEWSNAGVHAAAHLLDVPDIRSRVLADRQRWTDPSADVNDLLAAFGLDPLPRLADELAAAGITVSDNEVDMDPLSFGADRPFGSGEDGMPLPMQHHESPCGGPPIGSFAR